MTEQLEHGKEFKAVMDEIKAEDNLTPHQILTMDTYEYNKQLVVRAQERIKETS